MNNKIKSKVKIISKSLKNIETLFKENNFRRKNLKKLSKRYNKMKKIKTFYLDLKKFKKIKKESKELINNEEIKELAIEDYKNSKKKVKELKKKLNSLLSISREKINKVFLEIKTGVGGDESSIFISDLLKMYLKYSEKNKWKVKVISKVETNFKGYKEVTLFIKGKLVYKNLKYESGVHRVQRFPITETQSKIHTSTCRVAVLPERRKKNILINKNDLKIDTFKSSGAGGQHVNKTDSAVRIKHIPTGILVECQSERSQHKNKKTALKLLKIKIIKKNNLEQKNKNSIKKKFLMGQGNRSEKIRTYNYQKNRITDHRIKFSINNLSSILDGNLDEIINALKRDLNLF